MRRTLALLMALTVVFAVGATTVVYAGLGPATYSRTVSDEASGPLGPNPLAGDGYPDGSNLDSPNGPNGV